MSTDDALAATSLDAELTATIWVARRETIGDFLWRSNLRG